MKTNRFHAARERLSVLTKEAEALANKETPTAEETSRLQAIVETDMPAVKAELARWEAIHDAERVLQVRDGARIEVGAPRVLSDPKCGFRDLGEFGIAVRGALNPNRATPIDERLSLIQAAPTNPMEHGGDAGEGYMVPPEMRESIWKAVFGGEGILARMNPEPTNSNAVTYLKDETTPWGAQGVQAVWLDAGEQLTRSKAGTSLAYLQLNRLAAFVEVTDELLQDAPRLTARLNVAAPDAIAYKAEEAIVLGNGVGKPRGFGVSAALVEVPKKTGQAAATLVPHNFGSMWARSLNPMGSFWLGSKTTFPALLEMNVGNQPSFIPADRGMVGAQNSASLLGLPYIFSRHPANLGTTGDVYMVDPAGYALAIKSGGTKFDSSIHLFFDYGTTCFRWVFRIGGEPILSAPVTGPKSVTESSFLTVATRA